MKKIIAGIILSLTLSTIFGCEESSMVSYHDTHFGDKFIYVITEINGDEVNGLALTNINDENAGIVLSKELDGIKDIQSGQVVEVEYGTEYDEIVDVEVLNLKDYADILPKNLKDEFGRDIVMDSNKNQYITFYQ